MSNQLAYAYVHGPPGVYLSRASEEELLRNAEPGMLHNVIWFFVTLGPADESTWVDPNFMKTDPYCRAITHHQTVCPNKSTPSNDFFCRTHILHPPRWMVGTDGIVTDNPEYQGRK